MAKRAGSAQKEQKINIGCGSLVIPEFIGFDMNRAPTVQVQGKVTELPFKDNSINFIYAGHIVEHVPDSVLVHLSHNSFREVLGLDQLRSELVRILKPGGRIFIRVPYKQTGGTLYDIHHFKQFSKVSFTRWCTQTDSITLQTTNDFVIEKQYVSYLEIPFIWHIKKYLPSLMKTLTSFQNHEFDNDGRLRLRLGTGGRELTVVLRKLSTEAVRDGSYDFAALRALGQEC